ncbi:MAG: hypothetical protein EA407_02030 [Rhodobacteraceae bacterium]|nr:MAG: hypothetical protein EA407_02030 [Paracoccaceae bacterium]
MTKQLVIVVHGVGVRDAGTSTELLSAVLTDDILQPHSTDDFRLSEPRAYDHNGLVRTFPAHLRRYRARDDEGNIKRERVVADFYWGDIAAVRWGAIGAVLAFFRIAMGLGHAIRENARDVFPGGGANYWTRRAAGLAVLTIHGPVVALNILILLGLVVAFGAALWPLGRPGLFWELGITAALGVGVGLGLMRFTETYLSRFLGRWVITSALLVVVLGVLYSLAVSDATPDPLGLAARLCAIYLQAAAISNSTSCMAAFSGAYLVGLWLYVVMQVFIVIALALITVIALQSLRGYLRDAARRQDLVTQGAAPGNSVRVRGVNVTDLITPALGLMLLLWFVLISAVFGVLGLVGLGEQALVPDEEILVATLRGVLPALLGVVALVLVAVGIFIRKTHVFRSTAKGGSFLPADYLKDRERLAERYRLLVSKWMLAVPMVFLASLLGLYLHALGIWPLARAGWLDAALREWTGAFLFALALVSLALILYLREAFIAGLGILSDVLAYLNDYSWAHDRLEAEQGKDSQPTAQGARAFVAHDARQRLRFVDLLKVLFGLKLEPPPEGAPRGFWKRNRIQDRLRVFVETFLEIENPDQVIVISHSQGTVIALDVLRSDGARWRERLGALSLVTMGSPATHLYTHYFPTSFPDYSTDPVLQLHNTGGALDGWVNIFRVDDFVGTHITRDPASDWPREVPVPARGHTNYWIDRHVIRVLRAIVQHRKPVTKTS